VEEVPRAGISPKSRRLVHVNSQLHWSDWAELPRAGVASDIEPARMQVRKVDGGRSVMVGLRAKEEHALSNLRLESSRSIVKASR
jgi:hypothetical protein